MDTFADIAHSIDHSVLGPSVTERELEEGCAVGLRYEVASVCVLPYYLTRLAERLHGSRVRASTTIGFPHGGHTTRTKLAETEGALDEGAEEVDVVVNISKVMSNDFGYVERELDALTRLVHERGRIIKVIFETAYLDDARKKALCGIVGKVGADYAKTSTGFGPSGATLADIELMRAHRLDHTGTFRSLSTCLRGASAPTELAAWVERWRTVRILGGGRA